MKVKVADLVEASALDKSKKAKFVYERGNGSKGPSCAIGGVGRVFGTYGGYLGTLLQDIELSKAEAERAWDTFPAVRKHWGNYNPEDDTRFTLFDLITLLNDRTNLKKVEVFQQAFSVLNQKTLNRVLRFPLDPFQEQFIKWQNSIGL